MDAQPGLYRVLATDDGSNVNRFLHDRTGIHAQKDSVGNWDWMLKDGLGSVREVVDDNLNSLYTAQYAPYGEVWDTTGTEQTIFGYTGEPTDANDLVHLRARYYDPSLAVFNSLDPAETPNRYAYVGSNPINRTDPSGLNPVIPCVAMFTFPFDFGVIDTGCIVLFVTMLFAGTLQRSLEEAGVAVDEIQDIIDAVQEWLWEQQSEVGTGTSNEPEPDPEGSPRDPGPGIRTRPRQRPSDCVMRCPTQNGPSEHVPFAGTPDMLCHLACYNGADEVLKYVSLPSVPIELLSSQGRINGVFLEPSHRAVPADVVQGFTPEEFERLFGVTILDPDMRALTPPASHQAPNGLIAVRQPGVFGANRASSLATLVEEINHASLYHSSRCESITPYENELLAKGAKVNWIDRSTIPLQVFMGTERTWPEVITYVSGLPRNGRAFRQCPNEVNSTSGISLVSQPLGLQLNGVCVEPLVAQHIRF